MTGLKSIYKMHLSPFAFASDNMILQRGCPEMVSDSLGRNLFVATKQLSLLWWTFF